MEFNVSDKLNVSRLCFVLWCVIQVDHHIKVQSTRYQVQKADHLGTTKYACCL